MSDAAGRVCPRCARPAATTAPRCLYCGAPLPAAAAGPPEAAEPAASGPHGSRALLVVDLASTDATTLAAALAMPAFEAAQLTRRGGFHLHRAGDEPALHAEEARLRGKGLAATLVPEAEARLAPVVALRGRFTTGVLTVRHARGELSLAAPDVLMVVHGPIAREYQAR